MSFDGEGIQQSKEINYNDADTHLLKIDMPIGKLKFFVNSAILFLIQIIGIVLYYIFYFTNKTPEKFFIILCLFTIFIGIPLLYLNFVNYTKRMWDITGNLHRGIWFTVGLFAISFICIFLFPLAILFFYFAMIFIPGELIQNNNIE